MSNGRPLLFGQQPQSPPEIRVAAPMNDTQLIAMIAANRPDLTPVEAVEWACQIVEESVRTSRTLGERLRIASQG